MARTAVPSFVALEPDRRRSIARAEDRRITSAGLLLSVVFLGAAGAAASLPESVRGGLWLPLHLALAGAAGTAVASALPFFVAALSVTAPVRLAIRACAIGLVSGGAASAAMGIAGGASAVGLGGALAYLAGIGLTSVAAFWPLYGTIGPRRWLVLGSYGAGVAQVAIGVGLVSAMLAGVPLVVERWALLKPAHAWLNVFGFLSVVIAATLVHLAPTVVGSRIVPRRSAVVAMAGLIGGPPLIALGMGLGDGRVARLGAGCELVGALALLLHGLVIWRHRGTWSTDLGVRRLTSWSLLAAPAWLLVAVAIAAGRVLSFGAVPAAWSLDAVAAPLIVGWIVQVLVGAWSHLLPVVGPGDMATHARQRTTLGRLAIPRVGALNGGVGLLAIGQAVPEAPLANVGVVLCAGAVAASLVLLVIATGQGIAAGRSGAPFATGAT